MRTQPQAVNASIVVVEDCDEDYAALSRIFGGDGAARRFSQGTPAIAAFEAHDPSLSAITVLIVDLGLPDVSGIDVIRSVRAMRYGNHPAIFALASSERPADIIAASAAGIDDYFVKPRTIAGLRGIAARIADVADIGLFDSSGVTAPGGMPSGPREPNHE